MMISNKKSYTMRMLQLALALSLLHFDPHNYLQQQLHNWDTQLELHDGDGWELEMLRAVPMMEYPYVNRKSMMPLIDDLVQFDSIIRDGHTPSPYNITAYLLNISHEGSNETAAMQDIQTPNTLATGQTANGALNVTSNMSTISPSLNATTTAGLSGENRTGSNNSNETYTENGIDSCGDMSFASSLSSSCLASLLEQDDDSSFYLEEQRSVWEQNLADLNDFNDLPIITTPYAYLMQLKDNEQTSVELGFHDLHLEDFLPSISSINVECESILTPPVSRSTPISTLTSVAPSSSSSAPSNRFEGATALNGSFPHPNNGAAIKVEQLHDNDVTKNCLMNRTNLKVHDSKSNPKVQNCAEGLHIKSEPHEINQVKVEPLDDVNYKDDIKESIVMMENNKNTFINQVDFTKEESELVEVLWKQDIDLGYSLNLPQSTFSSDVTETSTITNNDNNNNNSNNKGNRECDATDNVNGIDIDNLEKLKALEELKLNNHNEFLSNDLSNNDENQLVDWSGIPFTIDNETGEYIRLPLDEILNDVIQFAELAIENDQIACNVNENTPTNDNKENNKILTSSTLSKCDLATTAPTQKQLYNRNLKERHSEIEGGELNNNDTFVLAIHNIKSKNNNNNNYKNNNNKINQAKRGEQSIAINKEEKIEEDGDNNLIPFDDVDNLSSPLFDLDDEAKAELAGLDMMLHSTTPFVASHHHAHPHTHAHSHGHPQPHPSHPPHPHVHHHHHPSSHHHAHHARTGSSGLTQHYGGVNSAFHRQPTTSAGFHHATHQSRMPLSRGVSMEQRLQDIASLFNPIPSMGVGVGVGVSVMGGVSEMSPYHYPTHHYSYQTPAGATSNGHVHGQYSAGIAAPPPPPPPPPHTHTPTHTHTHPHLQHTHAAAMHHANATTSLSDLCTTQPHYGHNLGSAVSSSMHLTNSTHDNDNVAGPMSGGHMGAYKMEHHDIMYYSNSSAADINHTTTDGFINSILNDEDLHLMDMNVNENFCRMVDVNNTTSNNSSVLGLSNHLTNTSGLAMSTDTHANLATIGVVVDGDGSSGGTGSNGGGGMNAELMVVGGSGTTDRLDASSDSAVSSMGSERLSSLSDGEWGEGSDSAQDYHPGKYGGGGDTGGSGGNGNAGIGIGVTVVGPYDYSYNNGGTMQNNNNNNNNHNNNNRQPTVAQKKHHMFGKRFINEQTSNANTMTNVPLSSMDRIQNQVAAQSIKYEYESYAPINAQNLHSNDIDIHAMAPIIAKDYNLYGNGSYSLDFSMRTPRTSHEIIQHNHTYTLPQEPNCLPRPQLRDKKQSITSNKLSVCATSSSSSGTSTARGKSHINDNNSISGEGDDDIYMTRDEKRARAMNIPIPVTDIINLPMDEFNERLSKYDLSENQLSLIRDIRRRGKNKVAAQNCRKRKLDQIISLEDEVKQVRQRKEELQQQRERLFAERKRVSTKFNTLHRHVFQYLRDAAGNPCSPSEYSLQQAPDGSIYLLPRDSMGNKNDSLNNGDVGVGVGDANTLLPLNINISAANHNNSSGGSSNGTGPMIVASSQESLQNQRSRSRGDRSQQGHKQQQQQQQQHQHTTLAFEHIQHQHEGRQQQHHHQQQHVSISSIAPTSAAATVTAAANGTSTQNDNIINGPHNAHQVLPHQPQKD